MTYVIAPVMIIQARADRAASQVHKGSVQIAQLPPARMAAPLPPARDQADKRLFPALCSASTAPSTADAVLLRCVWRLPPAALPLQDAATGTAHVPGRTAHRAAHRLSALP